jgi:four helix bundle protein
MGNQALRDRTKQFAVRVVKMYMKLPETTQAQVLGKQVLRSGTSVAANYREASRSRSTAEFVAKLGVVEQELDETMLWLELLVESGIVSQAKMAELLQESEELLKITVASLKTAKARR